MTLSSERANAVKIAREFLFSLLDPKKTPKVPSYVRKQARSVLRHYPGDFYLNDIFSEHHKRDVKNEEELLGKKKEKKYA